MSNIVKKYLRVLAVISSFNCEFDFKSSVGRKEKISDLEVVALSLTAGYKSIDSENYLFRRLKIYSFPNLIERSQFNKRCRKLFGFSEKVRLALASSFLEYEDYFIIHSMPLEICKNQDKTESKFVKKTLKLLRQKDILFRKKHGFMAIN